MLRRGELAYEVLSGGELTTDVQNENIRQVFCDRRRNIEQRITQPEYRIRVKRVPHRRSHTSIRVYGCAICDGVPSRRTVSKRTKRR